jgi:hypothetical protein
MAMRSLEDDPLPIWLNCVAVAIWLAAAVGAFLPFAVGTSPFDAVMRRVPNDEGNWWHILIGAPFFLAFPMIWLRLRAFVSRAPLSLIGRRALWIAGGLLMFGTLLVEAPFLAHRAGTSELQRLAVIAAGLGIPLVSISRLVARRRIIGATRACIAILTAAYLANASICLIVYGEAKFGTSSRSGWYLTIAIVWPMALELVWVLFGTDSTVRQAEVVY